MSVPSRDHMPPPPAKRLRSDGDLGMSLNLHQRTDQRAYQFPQLPQYSNDGSQPAQTKPDAASPGLRDMIWALDTSQLRELLTTITESDETHLARSKLVEVYLRRGIHSPASTQSTQSPRSSTSLSTISSDPTIYSLFDQIDALLRAVTAIRQGFDANGTYSSRVRDLYTLTDIGNKVFASEGTCLADDTRRLLELFHVVSDGVTEIIETMTYEDRNELFRNTDLVTTVTALQEAARSHNSDCLDGLTRCRALLEGWLDLNNAPQDLDQVVNMLNKISSAIRDVKLHGHTEGGEYSVVKDVLTDAAEEALELDGDDRERYLNALAAGARAKFGATMGWFVQTVIATIRPAIARAEANAKKQSDAEEIEADVPRTLTQSIRPTHTNMATKVDRHDTVDGRSSETDEEELARAQHNLSNMVGRAASLPTLSEQEEYLRALVLGREDHYGMAKHEFQRSVLVGAKAETKRSNDSSTWSSTSSG